MGILEKRAEALCFNCRAELDKICIPEILKCIEVIPIGEDAEKGILCIHHADWWEYIDCLYICPEYRRQGEAKKAVLEWYWKQSQTREIRLHIINKNKPAMRFWHKLFVLEEIEKNDVDTLYIIKKVK